MNSHRTSKYDIFTNEPVFDALSPLSQEEQLVADDAANKSPEPSDSKDRGGKPGG